MSTDAGLQGRTRDLLAGGAPADDVAVTVTDFLRDVRRVKRFTQAGVYTCLFASLPAYYFLLHFSPAQLLAVAAVWLVVATVAIEAAFARMYKLRKRSAYPGAVALQLGALTTFDAACQGAASMAHALLRVNGCFLTLADDGGVLNIVAANGLGRVDAGRYLRRGAACVQRAVSAKEPVSFRPDRGLLAEGLMSGGQRVVFVPVQSFRGMIGVLALLAGRFNSDLRDQQLLGSLGTAVGVSLENLRQRDELRTLAAIDELTKVYNRRSFFDHLDREIAAARRYDMPLSLVILDLDELKRLNDGFGHGLCDEALRTLAQRLVRYSRASDIVARLGGDEFAVLLPRIDAEGAREIVHRLQSAIEEEAPAAGPGRGFRLRVSCGFATLPDDADDADSLLRQADGRMYAAKAARSRGRRG